MVKRKIAEVDEAPCCESIIDVSLTLPTATDLASGFAALADPVRLRLLSMLGQRAEICACDFVEPLERSQPTISHHLRVLSEAGLINGEKRGRWVWYSLDRVRLAQLSRSITT